MFTNRLRGVETCNLFTVPRVQGGGLKRRDPHSIGRPGIPVSLLDTSCSLSRMTPNPCFLSGVRVICLVIPVVPRTRRPVVAHYDGVLQRSQSQTGLRCRHSTPMFLLGRKPSGFRGGNEQQAEANGSWRRTHACNNLASLVVWSSLKGCRRYDG